MFFSERDLFSIDLYLADAQTGKVIRKITDTATDPHFESLQFLGSAGAWDPTGKRFVFPAISQGQPVLTIVDVEQRQEGARDRRRRSSTRSSTRRGRLTASRSRSRAWSAGSTTCSSTTSRPTR